MSKHVLMLIHGMGAHPVDAWAKRVVDKLVDVSKRYDFFRNHPLDTLVEFVPVNYDHVFDKVLDNWARDSKKITDFAHSIKLPDADSLSWLEQAGRRETDFFWSSCADVLLYRFFNVVRNDIRINVIKQLEEIIDREIARNNTATPMCSVLAHSLGTTVAHDCFHLLGTGMPGIPNPYAPDHFKIQNFFMVANTSNLLQTDIDPYRNSLVRPGIQSDAHSCCYQYYNFRNEFDPFALTGKFNPNPVWGQGYHDISINHIHQVNVHDWLTYLENPRVHLPVLLSLSWYKAVKVSEQQQAITEFAQFKPGGVFTDLGAATAHLEGLKNVLGTGTAAGDLVNGLIKYASILGIDRLSSEAEAS